MQGQSPISLPPGHPLTFARQHLSDPAVARLVVKHGELSASERLALDHGQFSDAWDLLTKRHALEREIERRCRGD